MVQTQHGPDLSRLYVASPQQLRRATSPDVADALRDMMVSVVQHGTGRNAAIAGYVVGGKTGTAQTGAGQANHGWFEWDSSSLMECRSARSRCSWRTPAMAGARRRLSIAGQVMRAVIADRGEG